MLFCYEVNATWKAFYNCGSLDSNSSLNGLPSLSYYGASTKILMTLYVIILYHAPLHNSTLELLIQY